MFASAGGSSTRRPVARAHLTDVATSPCTVLAMTKQHSHIFLRSLQPYDWMWEDYLRQSSKHLDNLVMDWFSKMAHFITSKKSSNVVNATQLYFCEVYYPHSLLLSIVYDLDNWFLSHFWRFLWHLSNAKCDFNL